MEEKKITKEETIKAEAKKGFEKFQARVLELAGSDQEKTELCRKLSELELDFEFVKDLNTQLANKYQELMDCFPTSKEVELIIEIHKTNATPDEIERTTKLKKFKSALVCLEKQDPTSKPVRYDDLVKEE